MKKSFIITSMAAFAALCFSLTAQAQGPMVVSDKDDYGPGETALFSASGFLPNELLDFSIAVSDDNGGWIPDIAWADIPADASGSAEVEYVVPEAWLDKTLQLTVMGLESGLMATTTFTDATSNAAFATSGLPPSTSVSVMWSGFNPGGMAVSGTTVFSSPGPSAATGFSGGTALTFTFPASIIVGSDTYNLTGTSPVSGFILPDTGPPTPTTTITGTYELETEDNSPPEIECLDPTAELGAKVGCLVDGMLQADFAVSYNVVDGMGNSKIVQATFTTPGGDVTVDVANVTDADAGDTITVTTDPTSDTVTIVGPGSGSASFSVHIEASDGVNPTVETNPDCGGTANAQVTYDFHGFYPPLNNNMTTKVKRGSAVPVKFQLFDCSGTPISTGDHTISVMWSAGVTPEGPAEVDDAGASNGDAEPWLFRWDPTGMQWIFNLKTNTSYAVGATYKITATLDDETTHDVYISIK
jgi:hypothetical protein